MEAASVVHRARDINTAHASLFQGFMKKWSDGRSYVHTVHPNTRAPNLRTVVELVFSSLATLPLIYRKWCTKDLTICLLHTDMKNYGVRALL